MGVMMPPRSDKRGVDRPEAVDDETTVLARASVVQARKRRHDVREHLAHALREPRPV